MKNIWRIFVADLKGIVKNFFALVIVLGLCALPALYAWFNIFANWDPYSNTGNIKIAVTNLDQGWTNEDGEELNMGDEIIEELKQKDSIGWTFLDTEKEAIDGVYAGDYYAAVVIDQKFTYGMYNALAQDLQNPKITYYENQKKNAVASKITDTAVSTLQKSINEKYIKAVAETVFEKSNGVYDELQETDAVDAFIAKLDAVNNNLMGYSTMLSTFMEGNEQVADVTDDTSDSLSQSQGMINDGIASLDKGKQSLDKTKASYQDFSKNMTNSLTQLQNSINNVSSAIDRANLAENANQLQEDLGNAAIEAMKLGIEAGNIKEGIENLVPQDSVNGDNTDTNQNNTNANQEDQTSGNLLDGNLPNIELPNQNANQDGAGTNNSELQPTIDTLDQINSWADSIANEIAEQTGITLPDKDAVAETINSEDIDVSKLYTIKAGDLVQTQEDAIRDSLSNYSKTVQQINYYYSNQLSPQVNNLMDQMAQTLEDVTTLLTNLSSTMSGMDNVLKGANTTLGALNVSLSQLKDIIDNTRGELTKTLDQLKDASESEQMDIIMDLLSGNPEVYSEFFSEPVGVNENYIYEIKNYGSGVAPFYSTLAIWVGMTILVSILKVHAEKENLENVKPHQLFFGRYLLFGLLSQIQAAIIVLGDLYLLDIQCLHPFEFWLTAAVASLAFSLLIYALTIAFGDIGKALAVVIMVIQIAGSGGTYPIEALPSFFRAVYIFFPFPYAIDAMRECIGGMYQNNYAIYLTELMIFVVAALMIGLVIRIPFMGINHYIEKRMEDTKML